VVLDPVTSKGVLAWRQRSLSFDNGRWFLLSEPTSIPRLADATTAGDIASIGPAKLVGATPVGRDAFRIPSQNNAPEFYVIDAPHMSQRHVGSLTITDVADDPARVARLGLEARHTVALDYLSKVIPLRQSTPASERSLMIVWIGIAGSREQFSGAAGSRSFLANYLLDDDSSRGTGDAVVTMTMAHEQFHQLVDMLRGNAAPLAPWLSESLAEYYGLKALTRVDRSEAASTLRSKFIRPDVVPAIGLLGLNRAYTGGDHTRYGLFYSQGATFWSLVDRAIESSTAGAQSLDDHVAELLTMPANADGTLPERFIQRMRGIIGSRMDELLASYVSRPAQ
jgi:hypothetical protein